MPPNKAQQPTIAPKRAIAAERQRRWAVTVPSMAYWVIGAFVVGILVVAASCRRQTPAPAAPADAGSVFVFVRVPESLQPLDRASKYEDPLQLALDKANLGEVTGGGSQMTAPKADGTRDIEWVGIDVELASLERGLGFLKQELIRLGVPKGTGLEYERAGKKVEDQVH